MTLHEIRQQTGRMGGIATLEAHGKEHFSKLGLNSVRARGFEPTSEMLSRIKNEEDRTTQFSQRKRNPLYKAG